MVEYPEKARAHSICRKGSHRGREQKELKRKQTKLNKKIISYLETNLKVLSRIIASTFNENHSNQQNERTMRIAELAWHNNNQRLQF